MVHWGSKSLQLEGYHSGCVERRSKFAGYCEFDGQFSAVYFRGRFLLFARANMAPGGGARHTSPLLPLRRSGADVLPPGPVCGVRRCAAIRQ